MWKEDGIFCFFQKDIKVIDDETEIILEKCPLFDLVLILAKMIPEHVKKYTETTRRKWIKKTEVNRTLL